MLAALAVVAVLGTAVGVLRQLGGRLPTIEMLTPVLAATGVSAITILLLLAVGIVLLSSAVAFVYETRAGAAFERSLRTAFAED